MIHIHYNNDKSGPQQILFNNDRKYLRLSLYPLYTQYIIERYFSLMVIKRYYILKTLNCKGYLLKKWNKNTSLDAGKSDYSLTCKYD